MFEKALDEDYGQAIALASWYFARKADKLGSDLSNISMQDATEYHYKVFYDTVRIITLRMCTFINECLIKLHHNPEQPELKSKLIQTVVALTHGTNLIRKDDKHRIANAYNFSYSVINFEELIEQLDCKEDFALMVDALDSLVMVSKNEQFDTSALKNEEGCDLSISEEAMKQIEALESQDANAWVSVEDSSNSKFDQLYAVFKDQFKPWI